jgi:CDP-diacylglycerol--glycerol-3-phosphate 3-phosphatidyltransferase
MNFANKLTLLRVILSPVFFIIYFLPIQFSHNAAWTVPVLIIIFIVSELTDMFDGIVARKYNIIGDFGKVFDPFADTILKITYFLCFVLDGIFPAILFLVVIYREFGIFLLRNLMTKKGIAMGARLGGKIKTVSYVVAGSSALLIVSLQRLSLFVFLIPYIKIGALIIFIIAIIISILSLIDYILFYRKSI